MSHTNSYTVLLYVGIEVYFKRPTLLKRVNILVSGNGNNPLKGSRILQCTHIWYRVTWVARQKPHLILRYSARPFVSFSLTDCIHCEQFITCDHFSPTGSSDKGGFISVKKDDGKRSLAWPTSWLEGFYLPVKYWSYFNAYLLYPHDECPFVKYWATFVKTVTKFRIPVTENKFLTGWLILGFWRRTLIQWLG
jgi:hypothetical protein